MANPTDEKQRYWLTFTVKENSRPVVREIIRKCHHQFKICHANNFSDTVGIVAIEFEGAREMIDRAVRWLARKGVQVNPIELNVVED